MFFLALTGYALLAFVLHESLPPLEADRFWRDALALHEGRQAHGMAFLFPLPAFLMALFFAPLLPAASGVVMVVFEVAVFAAALSLAMMMMRNANVPAAVRWAVMAGIALNPVSINLVLSASGQGMLVLALLILYAGKIALARSGGTQGILPTALGLTAIILCGPYGFAIAAASAMLIALTGRRAMFRGRLAHYLLLVLFAPAALVAGLVCLALIGGMGMDGLAAVITGRDSIQPVWSFWVAETSARPMMGAAFLAGWMLAAAPFPLLAIHWRHRSPYARGHVGVGLIALAVLMAAMFRQATGGFLSPLEAVTPLLFLSPAAASQVRRWHRSRIGAACAVMILGLGVGCALWLLYPPIR